MLLHHCMVSLAKTGDTDCVHNLLHHCSLPATCALHNWHCCVSGGAQKSWSRQLLCRLTSSTWCPCRCCCKSCVVRCSKLLVPACPSTLGCLGLLGLEVIRGGGHMFIKGQDIACNAPCPCFKIFQRQQLASCLSVLASLILVQGKCHGGPRSTSEKQVFVLCQDHPSWRTVQQCAQVICMCSWLPGGTAFQSLLQHHDHNWFRRECSFCCECVVCYHLGFLKFSAGKSSYETTSGFTKSVVFAVSVLFACDLGFFWCRQQLSKASCSVKAANGLA